MGDFVGSAHRRSGNPPTGPGMRPPILRAYIEGNIGFIATHRAQMQALLQIVLRSAGLPSGAADRPADTPLEGLLRHGQSTGEFRDFDVQCRRQRDPASHRGTARSC